VDKWIVTNRRANDYVIHRPGETRGICTTWEQSHADRIAAALNRGADIPVCPACAKLVTAGNILSNVTDNLVDENGDIPLSRLTQLINAREYWRIVTEEYSPNPKPQTPNQKENPHG
jgi:hypothetical protein